MINKILDGITVKLDKVFGYPIYTDDLEQGFKEPCFLVEQLSTTTNPQLLDRRKENHLFHFTFFPSGGRRQTNEVQFSFLDEFRLIELADGSMVHGIDLRTESHDGVLDCFVNCNVIMDNEKIPSEYMQDLEIGEAL